MSNRSDQSGGEHSKSESFAQSVVGFAGAVIPEPQSGSGPNAGPTWFILRATPVSFAIGAAFGVAAPFAGGMEVVELSFGQPDQVEGRVEFFVLTGSCEAVLDGITTTLGTWDFLTSLSPTRMFTNLLPDPCSMLVL